MEIERRTRLVSQEINDKIAGFVGFQWSHVGMACVAAVAADRRNDTATVAKHVATVAKLVASCEGKYDDFDSGRAGLLYAARFLQVG